MNNNKKIVVIIILVLIIILVGLSATKLKKNPDNKTNPDVVEPNATEKITLSSVYKKEKNSVDTDYKSVSNFKLENQDQTSTIFYDNDKEIAQQDSVFYFNGELERDYSKYLDFANNVSYLKNNQTGELKKSEINTAEVQMSDFQINELNLDAFEKAEYTVAQQGDIYIFRFNVDYELMVSAFENSELIETFKDFNGIYTMTISDGEIIKTLLEFDSLTPVSSESEDKFTLNDFKMETTYEDVTINLPE